MRAYDWLGVSLAALVDVNEGYKVAYGGEQRCGGIEVLDEERKSPPPLKTNFRASEIRRIRLESPPPGGNVRPVSPQYRGLMLRSNSPGAKVQIRPSASREVEVGESAQGLDRAIKPRSKSPAGSETSVKLTEDRGPHRRGATTPNGFEDITPVTKGEWLCLMVGEEWKETKTAPVVICT